MKTHARAVVIKDRKILIMERNKFGKHYLALLGGAIERGETAEEAAIREVQEESTIKIANLRLIIIQESNNIYGRQYIFLADYISGEAKLNPSSIEAKIAKKGNNLYQPKWLEVEALADSELLPSELRDLLVKFITDGFPENTVKLHISSSDRI